MPKTKTVRDLNLTCEAKEGKWEIRGKKTYDYRFKLKEAGGIWDKGKQAWLFKTNPESLVQTLNAETAAGEAYKAIERQERGRQLAESNRQAAEFRKVKQAERATYDQFMNDPVNKAEVDRVTHEMFTSNHPERFWPLTEAAPHCYVSSCRYHILWVLYEAANRDIAAASASYHMECPKCFTDFTR